MEVKYDPRFVPAHDNIIHGQVLLMNEAPGPDEAASGIPLYGQQGANLFHALRAAGIKWAVNHDKFTWPKNDSIHHEGRQCQKKSFLATRSKYITCTNSYPNVIELVTFIQRYHIITVHKHTRNTPHETSAKTNG